MNVEKYLETLELPALSVKKESTFESAESGPATLTGEDQVIAIGSQIAEFASSVAEDIREDISNSLLLAQLAADKAAGTPDNAQEWYNAYIDVLKNIGWLVEDASWNMQEFDGVTAEVHKAVIPVITAALGASGITSALIIDLLNGLAEVSKDQPWITLFDKASKRAYGGQFQISYIHTPPGGKPVMVVAFFGLEGDTTLVQVLFLKLSESSINLSQGKSSLSINEEAFRDAAPKVQKKVAGYVSDFIDNLDLT